MKKSIKALAKESYYTKEAVYGEDPLKEIIYEIEDMLLPSPQGKFVWHDDLHAIFERHSNTVKLHRLMKKEKLSDD